MQGLIKGSRFDLFKLWDQGPKDSRFKEPEELERTAADIKEIVRANAESDPERYLLEPPISEAPAPKPKAK